MNNAEARLKAAVIDRLISSKIFDANSVLVSELTVANWAHRTDIVLANGKLWGFELKSERDSLSRLPTQIEAFSQHFEKFVVVVADKFEARAEKLVRNVSGTGLWIATESGTLIEKIRPSARPMAPAVAISLMTVKELRKFLVANGFKDLKQNRRAALIKLAFELPPEALADGARTAIKERFRQVHERFLNLRESSGSLSALPALSRVTGSRIPVTELTQTPNMIPYPQVPKNHPNLINAPAGPVIARARR